MENSLKDSSVLQPGGTITQSWMGASILNVDHPEEGVASLDAVRHDDQGNPVWNICAQPGYLACLRKTRARSAFVKLTDSTVEFRRKWAWCSTRMGLLQADHT